MIYRLFFPCFLCLRFFVLSAQVSENPEVTTLLYDNLVGIEHTDIHKGIIFTPTYRVINEFHQYFESSDFISGSIIYDNQFYYNIKLRYDIHDDSVFALFSKSVSTYIVELDKSKIKSFLISGKTFVNISTETASESEINGFYQQLYNTEQFSFYKKTRKRLNKKLDKNIAYYEFDLIRPIYTLWFEDVHYAIKNKRIYLKIFTSKVSDIKKFNKKNKEIYKSDIEFYSIALLQHLNNLNRKTDLK